MSEYGGLLDNNNTNEFIPGCVGRVSANTELKIVDIKTGKSLGPNEDGEICLRGPKLFSEYLNNENATKDAIDSNGWFRTGDIGHYDEDERLFVTDRLKELIKFKAWSVAPAEIESCLLSHESVDSVVVIGVKHKTDGQFPRAYVRVKDGKCVTEEELIEFVRGLDLIWLKFEFNMN
jgi:acyl-CoA synthetase (AMP-forming)/AMP-acid ligase II